MIEKKVLNVGILYIRCMRRVTWHPVCVTSLEFAHWPIKEWVIFLDYITHSWIGQCANSKLDYITHSWIGQCANSKLVTRTDCHVTLRIHLIHSMPTFDTLSLSYTLGMTQPSILSLYSNWPRQTKKIHTLTSCLFWCLLSLIHLCCPCHQSLARPTLFLAGNTNTYHSLKTVCHCALGLGISDVKPQLVTVLIDLDSTFHWLTKTSNLYSYHDYMYIAHSSSLLNTLKWARLHGITTLTFSAMSNVAPDESSSLTQSVWPLLAAHHSGVRKSYNSKNMHYSTPMGLTASVERCCATQHS